MFVCVCAYVCVFLNGLVPEQGHDPNVHDRDPNVSTHIRIVVVLWDQTIKGLCVFVLMCVFFV